MKIYAILKVYIVQPDVPERIEINDDRIEVRKKMSERNHYPQIETVFSAGIDVDTCLGFLSQTSPYSRLKNSLRSNSELNFYFPQKVKNRYFHVNRQKDDVDFYIIVSNTEILDEKKENLRERSIAAGNNRNTYNANQAIFKKIKDIERFNSIEGKSEESNRKNIEKALTSHITKYNSDEEEKEEKQKKLLKNTRPDDSWSFYFFCSLCKKDSDDEYHQEPNKHRRYGS